MGATFHEDGTIESAASTSPCRAHANTQNAVAAVCFNRSLVDIIGLVSEYENHRSRIKRTKCNRFFYFRILDFYLARLFFDAFFPALSGGLARTGAGHRCPAAARPFPTRRKAARGISPRRPIPLRRFASALLIVQLLEEKDPVLVVTVEAIGEGGVLLVVLFARVVPVEIVLIPRRNA
jgi:hypothetical protein